MLQEKVWGRRLGALALLVVAGAAPEARATPASPAPLFTGKGDGYVVISTDEFGNLSSNNLPDHGASAFDPAGPLPVQSAVWQSSLVVFDQAGTIRQVLDAPELTGSDFRVLSIPGVCAPAAYFTATQRFASDLAIGTHGRLSSFQLDGFPNLRVDLWQTACTGASLTQAYTFVNTGNVDYHLRLVRAVDADVPFEDYTNDHVALLAPGRPAVLDAAGVVSVAIGAAGDGTLEGYRLWETTGNAVSILSQAFMGYGFPQQNLNGIFRTLEPEGGEELNYCAVTLGTDEQYISAAADPSFAGDDSMALQTALDVPAHQSRTYVAETFWSPAGAPNAPPESGCPAPDGALASAGVIQGRVVFDNAVCSANLASDPGAPGRWVRIAQGGTTRYAITDAGGTYSASVPPGSYDVTLLHNPFSVETCGAPAGVDHPVTVDDRRFSNGNDFSVTSSSCDATATLDVIYPPFNPLTDTEGPPTACGCDTVDYCVTVDNVGNQAIAGGIVTLALDPNIVYVATETVGTTAALMNPTGACLPSGQCFGGDPLAPPPCHFAAPIVSQPPGTSSPVDCCSGNVLAGQQIDWTLTAPLNPLKTCAMCAKARVCNVPLVVSPGPIVLTTTASLDGGCLASSIVAQPKQEAVQCSRDPNDVEVSPRGCGPAGIVPQGQTLSYVIHFQNDGNAPAQRVVVVDTLDPALDLSTLQILRASHPLASVEIRPGNQLVWTFDGIGLAPVATDPPGSMGYVAYTVAPSPGLPDGTTIAATASIYFDANPAVLTGTTVNTLGDPCAAPDQCHVAGTCDPGTGLCVNPAAPDGTACSDGDACTAPDTCHGGACTSGPNACAPTCVTLQRGLSGDVADALIASGGGSDGGAARNYGSSSSLPAGGVGGGQRQALVRFDLSGIPRTATITSATATLTVILYGGAPVRAHRVLAPWVESTVTWNGLGGAYLPAVEATFPAAQVTFPATATTSASFTSLVQAWVNGSTENDGILLERDLAGGTVFASSESVQASRPRLDVCYLP